MFIGSASSLLTSKAVSLEWVLHKSDFNVKIWTASEENRHLFEKFGYEVACPWEQRWWFKLGRTSGYLYSDEKEPMGRAGDIGVRRYTWWSKDQFAFAPITKHPKRRGFKQYMFIIFEKSMGWLVSCFGSSWLRWSLRSTGGLAWVEWLRMAF